MTTDPVGSLAEEAAKLVAALQGWGKDAGAAGGEPGAADEQAAHERSHDPLSPECRFCPLCSLARVAKAATPEVRDHLASAALSLALAVKGLVDNAAPPRSGGTAASPVEKIDLAED